MNQKLFYSLTKAEPNSVVSFPGLIFFLPFTPLEKNWPRNETNNCSTKKSGCSGHIWPLVFGDTDSGTPI